MTKYVIRCPLRRMTWKLSVLVVLTVLGNILTYDVRSVGIFCTITMLLHIYVVRYLKFSNNNLELIV